MCPSTLEMHLSSTRSRDVLTSRDLTLRAEMLEKLNYDVDNHVGKEGNARPFRYALQTELY